jgi:nucleoside 2-deoxyribosyltransferase
MQTNKNRPCLYFSASLISAPNNAHIAKILKKSGLKVLLPQEFVPSPRAHETYELSIYRACIDAMKQSDGYFVNLDAFREDSSMECGWAAHAGLPAIGYVESSLRFLEVWMVKGTLDAVFTPNRRIYQACRKDPMLVRKRLVLLRAPEELGRALRKYLHSRHSIA